MVRNTTAVKVEWPAPPQRGVVRRRRDSKVAYHNNAKYFHRNIPAFTTTPTSSASETSSAHPNVEIPPLAPPGQAVNIGYLEFIDFQGSPTAPIFDHSAQFVNRNQNQDDRAETSWLSTSMVSYTLPTHPPNSPQSVRHGSSSPSAQMFNNELQFSYQTATLTPANYIGDVDALSTSSRFGSFDSFDSMAMSIANTVASSVSDSFACPNPTSSLGSPGSANLPDLTLPEGYFQNRYVVDTSPVSSINSMSPTYPESFSLDGDYNMIDWSTEMYPVENGQYSTVTLTQQLLHEQKQYAGDSPIPTHSPWNSQFLQGNSYGTETDAGCVAFEPPRGAPYDTYLIGEQYLETAQRDSKIRGAEPVSPAGTEDWQVVPSQESPHSEASPWSRISSPPRQSPPPSSASPQAPTESHSHIFSAYPGVPNSKLPRGRQRALTSQEKREALDVRKAKACWACHLSKIKCSPCSPGTPCQQCERLSGKRRFCWLPCFNDPLETLQPFLAPEYLFGDFAEAKVECFIKQNAISWGKHEMTIRLNWGYSRPIQAQVVTLAIHEDSKLGCCHQTIGAGTAWQAHVKQRSAPLGLPLASMSELKEQYSDMVQEIIMNNPNDYVERAYDDQASWLPEELLQAVTNFYSAGLAAGDECEPLRQALEIHVTTTILDRSLLLDDESRYEVEHYLQQRYPATSASRCAQMQIKLAFFEVQKVRIVKVLETWGNMMWTSNKHTSIEKKWAWSFSILIVLTLVIDRNLINAHWTCENRIATKGANAENERAEFQRIVRLTQTELFERCKEIFHSSFKTRKGGKEACNPIRDGIRAFRGKVVNEGISRFVWDMDAIMREHGPEIKFHRSSRADEDENPDEMVYKNAGRLASIFLADFLDH